MSRQKTDRRWETLKPRLNALAATAVLLVALATLAAAVGYLIAGQLGAITALALVIGSSVGGSRYVDRYVLRSMGARRLMERDAPRLWQAVHDLSRKAEIPMPRLWLVPHKQPNAFTVGRSPATASLAVTSGLLEELDGRGVTGVLAHELAHIRHRDTLLNSFAATVTSTLRSLGRVLGLFVLLAFPVLLFVAPRLLAVGALLAIAPLVALLLQKALSRQREFAADAAAARLTGDPAGLAAALQRIEHRNSSLLSLLFGRGRRPLNAPGTPLDSHPPTTERVQRLRALNPTAAPWPAARPIPIRPRRPVARVFPGHQQVPRVSIRHFVRAS